MNESPQTSDEVLAAGTAQDSGGQVQSDSAIVHDHADDRKQLETFKAILALHGVALFELADDTFLATKWNLTRPLRDLHAVASFVRQIGGAM